MRGSPERRRSGLRGRRIAPRRAGMTTSVPITRPFLRDTRQKSRSVIYPPGGTRANFFSLHREGKSERNGRLTRERRAIARRIDAIIDAEEAHTGADAQILDEGWQSAHAGIPC